VKAETVQNGGGEVMPTYEYQCLTCKKPFEVVMSISEYEKSKVKCPKCKKGKVKQQITAFMVQTSKKS
jgi:putative FmdB family regulatory protein